MLAIPCPRLFGIVHLEEDTAYSRHLWIGRRNLPALKSARQVTGADDYAGDEREYRQTRPLPVSRDTVRFLHKGNLLVAFIMS